MSASYILLLSPHPDDLVFSAFTALAKKENKLALVFFNVSSFTRWPIKSKSIVTSYRTFEDLAILRSLGAKVKFLNLEDNSLKKPGQTIERLEAQPKLSAPEAIYSPLGVGDSPNHTQVREWAIDHWIVWEKRSALYFYEDLPYAAKSSDSASSENTIIAALKEVCGPIEKVAEPLTQAQIARKMRYCKFYFSQTDYSKIIADHARKMGSAEIFYRAA